MAIHTEAHFPPPGGRGWWVELRDDELPLALQLDFEPPDGDGDRLELRRVGYTGPGLERPGTLAAAVERFDSHVRMARAALTVNPALGLAESLRAAGQGRAGLSESFLRAVAAEYHTYSQRGEPPVASIAEAHGVTRSTASRWLSRARKLGLLQ